MIEGRLDDFRKKKETVEKQGVDSRYWSNLEL